MTELCIPTPELTVAEFDSGTVSHLVQSHEHRAQVLHGLHELSGLAATRRSSKRSKPCATCRTAWPPKTRSTPSGPSARRWSGDRRDHPRVRECPDRRTLGRGRLRAHLQTRTRSGQRSQSKNDQGFSSKHGTFNLDTLNVSRGVLAEGCMKYAANSPALGATKPKCTLEEDEARLSDLLHP